MATGSGTARVGSAAPRRHLNWAERKLVETVVPDEVQGRASAISRSRAVPRYGSHFLGEKTRCLMISRRLS
jgi:hypothetical protein